MTLNTTTTYNIRSLFNQLTQKTIPAPPTNIIYDYLVGAKLITPSPYPLTGMTLPYDEHQKIQTARLLLALQNVAIQFMQTLHFLLEEEHKKFETAYEEFLEERTEEKEKLETLIQQYEQIAIQLIEEFIAATSQQNTTGINEPIVKTIVESEESKTETMAFITPTPEPEPTQDLEKEIVATSAPEELLQVVVFENPQPQLTPLVPQPDYYQTLNVNSDASSSDIKKSFHKLSLQWHPDKHLGKTTLAEAKEKYLKIVEARDILLDPEKRTHYDSNYKKTSQPTKHLLSENIKLLMWEEQKPKEKIIEEKLSIQNNPTTDDLQRTLILELKNYFKKKDEPDEESNAIYKIYAQNFNKLREQELERTPELLVAPAA